MNDSLSRDPRTLKSLLGELVAKHGWEEKVTEVELEKYWKVIVGEKIAKAAKATKIINGELFIETQSSTWRAELMLRREKLKEELNKLIGKEYIKIITIR